MSMIRSLLSSFAMLFIFSLLGCTSNEPSNKSSESENKVPVAIIQSSSSFETGETVSVDGSNSTDADNDPLTYNWSISTPNGSTSTLNSLTNSVVEFIPDIEGDYVVSLVVFDGTDTSPSTSQTISVTQASVAPVAVITAADGVVVGSSISASASNSSDANNDSLTYLWSLTSPSNSTTVLSSQTSLETSFTPDMQGEYVLSLTVNDGQFDSEVASKVITASPVGGGQAIVLKNNSDQELNQTAFSFATVFSAGHAEADDKFELQLSTGEILKLQTNKKATHSDGSLRHAIFSGLVPTMSANQELAGQLSIRTSDIANTSLSLSELLAKTWDATVNLNVGGVDYSVSAKTLLTENEESLWIDGEWVKEWVVQGPPKTVGGVAHPHLNVLFNVRVYGDMEAVWTSVTIENSWAYELSPQNFSYNGEVNIDGDTVYTVTDLLHLRNSRWRKSFWNDNQENLHIEHDVAYLIETGAIPNYDPSLINNISSATIDEYENYWVDETVAIAVDDEGYLVEVGSGGHDFYYNKIGPMGIGLANAKMPTTGARPDIGPLPRWVSVYLLNQDPISKKVALGMANSGGSWSIHYRDKDTGLPLSINDYPYASSFWYTPASDNPNTGLNEHTALCTLTPDECVVPYTADTSHQPSLAYVPYLVTGDHFYLEELMFWSNYNLLEMNPTYRSFEQGLFSVDLQDRAQAWSMRTLGHSAYITPDNHPMKDYFEDILTNNINDYHTKYVVNSPNNYGAMTPNYSYPTASPWMDDFFTWSIGSLVDLGYTSANDLLNWKAKFSIQRMGYGSNNPDDYCWIFAPAYHVLIAAAEGSPMFSNISEVYDGTNGREIPWGGGFNDYNTECGSQAQGDAIGLQQGEMIGYSSSPTGFPSNLQIALAVSAQTGIEGSSEAWARFMNRSVKPDYTTYPNYAIVPRD